MRALRQRVSDKLLAAGANTALDRQAMLRSMRRKGGMRTLTWGEAQALGMLDLISDLKIWLGMLIMPSRPPKL